MAKNQPPPISVKEVVYKLQLALLDGVRTADQLAGAGAVISRSDYGDVVTERSIAELCGYPLCRNSLPSDRTRKGRYRISLKEHKVYDLHETYLYCSSDCLIASRTFSGGLQEERVKVLDSARIGAVLAMLGDEGFEKKLGFGTGDLGVSKLRIEERTGGESTVEELPGPSNAIEGYVPRRDRRAKPSKSSNRGSKDSMILINDMDFMSTIITQDDEYTVSKTPSSSSKTDSDYKLIEPVDDLNSQFSILEIAGEKHDAQEALTSGKTEKKTRTRLRSSLKNSRDDKLSRSVTWADDKTNCDGERHLCEIRAIEDSKDDVFILGKKNKESLKRAPEKGDSSREKDTSEIDDNDVLRYSSADACARALKEASEAVASDKIEVSDAISEAGIIVLPPQEVVDKEEDEDISEPEQAPIKWPEKPGSQSPNLFNPEDSWFDLPPDGFNLTLSAFAKMWNALFTWTNSSTLAYIYGKDESLHEEYQSVNGRDYPQKIVLGDGRSSEIKQTLAGSLSRALPGLVADLRLPTPISSLEQGMGRLLETMSFLDSLPPFRMKQWQVITLVFIEALSVYRLPAITPHLTSRRALIHKVLDGAQISVEEYEIMKDLMIPLGRIPHFSSQSGA